MHYTRNTSSLGDYNCDIQRCRLPNDVSHCFYLASSFFHQPSLFLEYIRGQSCTEQHRAIQVCLEDVILVKNPKILYDFLCKHRIPQLVVMESREICVKQWLCGEAGSNFQHQNRKLPLAPLGFLAVSSVGEFLKLLHACHFMFILSLILPINFGGVVAYVILETTLLT